MQETYFYHVEVECQIEEHDFNTTSPLRVTVARTDTESTLLTLHADQSGLVGLIRHLHHQGFVLLSVTRK